MKPDEIVKVLEGNDQKKVFEAAKRAKKLTIFMENDWDLVKNKLPKNNNKEKKLKQGNCELEALNTLNYEMCVLRHCEEPVLGRRSNLKANINRDCFVGSLLAMTHLSLFCNSKFLYIIRSF